MTIDAHQHFWRMARGDYGWLTPGVGAIYRDFEPGDLRPLLDDSGVRRTVVVQAAPTVAETEFLLSLARDNDFIAGVVGWVDMDDPALAGRDLARLAVHEKLVGIRPMIQDIDDPDWMLQGRLGPLFEQLAELQLCFDALVLPIHLPNLLALLQRHPGLRAVIDHAAKPDIAGGQWQPWADQMAALGRETPCYCKLSGLLTEAGERTSDEHLQRYVNHLLDCFGPERLLWGSDWPVLNLAGDYNAWQRQALRLVGALDEAAKGAIFGGNAAHFYQLETL